MEIERRGGDWIRRFSASWQMHCVYGLTRLPAKTSLVSLTCCSSTIFYRLVMRFEGNLRATSQVSAIAWGHIAPPLTPPRPMRGVVVPAATLKVAIAATSSAESLCYVQG